MDLLIRRHILNDTYNSSYFGEFTNLLTLDLSEDLINLLFTFLESSQDLKKTVRPLITNEEGYPPIFYKADSNSVYGYSSLGFTDLSIFEERMKPLPQYLKMLDITNQLWNKLGWTMSEPKIIKIDVGEFNPETAMYNGYPTTFSEVEALWNLR